MFVAQFRYPAVQRYIHDITGEMGDHLDSITSTLSMFIEIGMLSEFMKFYLFLNIYIFFLLQVFQPFASRKNTALPTC